MKKRLIICTSIIQMILVKISYLVCCLFNKNKKDGWVVVAVETASMLKNISSALPNSVAVNFAPNRFYDFNYDYEVYPKKGIFKIGNLIYSSLLFGYLLSKYDKFLYLGSVGFLNPYVDGRQAEFEFLKKSNKRIVCYFLGSEIRSYKLLDEFGVNKGIDTLTTYERYSSIGIDSNENENKRKRLAKVAEKYANCIFNAPVDQMTYIDINVHDILYFYPDNEFQKDNEKFDNLSMINILHSPTSPILKGTQLVRAAIKKLELEGYIFNYVELKNASNSKVLATLKESHIVLNQFYAFVPGVFGIEALVHNCAMLTSADSNIEPTLGLGANEAWLVTPYWQVYDNLKYLLDNPEEIKAYADRGFDWAYKNCRASVNGQRLNSILND
ncbi:hypothetical protein ACRN9G_07315 [Shewanella frigidimarina]|uniref:hypothetical protein n=1 Tax=Shewanella frigidimarina TaxID=56812 RepID=UPI003D7C0B46